MRPTVKPPSLDSTAPLAPEALLDLLKWHLDRYDRLRSSTASRASVVLGAGAVLTTGDAIIFTQVLGHAEGDFSGWPQIFIGCGLMLSAMLVVLVVIRACGVLVTLKSSRALFASNESLPSALLFNGPDTLNRTFDFAQFQAAVRVQSYEMMIDAAQVELWFVIQQHRYRYARLRSSALLLTLSALTLLISLIGLLIVFVVRA